MRKVKLQKHWPLQSGSLLVGNQPRRRRRLPPSLTQRSRLPVQNLTRAMGMKRRRARKKRRRKRRARQQRKWQRSRGPGKPGPGLHSSSQPEGPNQEASPQSHRLRVRCPLLRHWVLRCKLFRSKSNFFACSDILCARARAMHFFFDDLYAVTSCGTFFLCDAFFLRCGVGVCARPRAKKGSQKMLLVVQRATWLSETDFPKD